MAGIWNINSTYNVNSKKIMNKISFEMGEEFLARIIDVDALSSDVLLKMLDGWQFHAELDNKSDTIPEGIVRFKVEGFQDGKLKLKVLNTEKEPEREISSLIKTLEEQKVDVSKDDFKVLEKMIKHSMPLTRENISKVKSIFEFKGRIENQPEEIDNFVQKFLESKGVDSNSPKGKEITVKLKDFFDGLKSISENDILTLMENDLEINHENVKSFNRVFKESQIIYKELAAFAEVMDKSTPAPVKQTVEEGRPADQNASLDAEEPVSTGVETKPETKSQTKPELIVKAHDLKGLSDIVKEEINLKSDNVKKIVMDIISSRKNGEPGIKEEIINFLQQSGNDFKVFNTISNQYYYYDLPLKVEKHDYGCKLIIKDERKKGKKIDSSDVKIAASINTENMGEVASYITVKNYNMSVEIKSHEKFVKVIDSAKEILLTELSNLGYNISVKVSRLDNPLNISNSRDFFQDNDLVNINVRV